VHGIMPVVGVRLHRAREVARRGAAGDTKRRWCLTGGGQGRGWSGQDSERTGRSTKEAGLQSEPAHSSQALMGEGEDGTQMASGTGMVLAATPRRPRAPADTVGWTGSCRVIPRWTNLPKGAGPGKVVPQDEHCAIFADDLQQTGDCAVFRCRVRTSMSLIKHGPLRELPTYLRAVCVT